MEILTAYLLVFSASLCLSYGVHKLVLPLSVKLGYLDQPSQRKLHQTAVPYGGGIAIFASMAILGMLVYLVLKLGLGTQILSQHIHINALLEDPRACAIALGGTGIFLLGLFDDIFDIRPRIKLFVQITIISAVLYYGRMQMSFFVPIPMIGFVVTLFWMILITNAFNLLDNMDGLCSGISLLTLTVHFTILALGGQYLIALLTISLMGIIVVFFNINRPPARQYLGDAGSLLLGFLIAMLSILSTYYREGQALTSIFTPLLILAIPIYDVVTVMHIRKITGKPFFEGDKNHFSHRLLSLGFSSRQALMIISALTLAMGIGAILLIKSSDKVALLIFLQAFLIFIVIRVIENASLKAHYKNSSSLQAGD